ncbi:MAG: hypothetical protein ACFCBW_02315 [Candidatus Competibacterales bacterium]
MLFDQCGFRVFGRRVFGETNYGLEWVEEQLLAQHGISKTERPIAEILAELLDENAPALNQ